MSPMLMGLLDQEKEGKLLGKSHLEVCGRLRGDILSTGAFFNSTLCLTMGHVLIKLDDDE